MKLHIFPTALDIFACTVLVCAQILWPDSNWPFIFAAIHYGCKFLFFIVDYRKDSTRRRLLTFTITEEDEEE